MYLYYKIPGRAVSKKNHQQIAFNNGRPFVTQSKPYKKYEKMAKDYLKPLDEPINEPVNVKVTYWIPKNKDGSVPKTKLDLVNLLSCTDDLLVKYQIVEDDNCRVIAGHDGSRVIYTIDEPYTEIEIEDLR